MKIHVSDLEGVALDWATGTAVGVEMFTDGGGVIRHGALAKPWSPSSSWADCGPLIDEFDVQICGSSHAGYLIYATKKDVCKEKKRGATGFDLKQTICRAVLAAKLGDEIEIPDELVKSI